MSNNFFKTGRPRLSTCSFMAWWRDKPPRIIAIAVPIIFFALASPVLPATKLFLSDAIARSAEHNYAVSSARHDSVAAARAYIGARAERYPVLSLDARSYYVDELQKINLPFGSTEIGTKENYQADLKLAVPLYTGGRLSNRIGIEQQNRDAAGQTLAAERMAAAYRCRQAYFNVLSAQAELKAASSSLNRLDIIRQDIRNLFENGMADSLDIIEAEMARQKGEQQKEHQENACANALANLTIIIGADETEEIILSEPIALPVEPRYPAAVSSSPINRPELARYDHIIRASELAIGVERGTLAPALSGYAGYTYGNPNKDMSGETWNDNFIVGLNLNWEFNLGGRVFKHIESANSRAASARMAKKNLLDALLVNRNVALNNLNLAYRTYRISEKEYRLVSDQFRLAQMRQAAGQISTNRLLEIEAELTTGEQQYQASIIQFYLAENEYLYAIGSGRIFGGLQ